MALDSATIESLTITESEGGTSYDIAELSGGWAIGAVPSMQCRIITGLDVFGGSASKEWTPPTPGTLWTITIRTGGQALDLFTGYIVSFAETGAPSATGSSLSIQLSLAGRAALLSSTNAGSYVYWNMTASDVNDSLIKQRPLVASDYQALGTDIKNIYATTKFKDTVEKASGLKDYSAAVNMQKFMLALATYLHAHVSYESAAESLNILDYFTVDRDIKFLSDPISVSQFDAKISESMITAYHRHWMSGSVWTALGGTAGLFYLSVVPRRTTMELVPVLGWLKKPHLTIDRTMVLGVGSTASLADLLYTPDQVVAVGSMPQRYNSMSEAMAKGFPVGVYPPFDALTGRPQSRSVTISLPDWLCVYATTEKGADPVPPDDYSPMAEARLDSQREPEKLDAETAAREETALSTVERFAKMYFGRYKNANQGITLRVPWNRFGLIDSLGYVVKIPDLATYSDRAGHTLYGMINSVGVSIARSATGGRATMQLEITQTRDEQANEKYAFDAHPFYSFDFQSGADKVVVGAGIRKSQELNLESRLAPVAAAGGSGKSSTGSGGTTKAAATVPLSGSALAYAKESAGRALSAYRRATKATGEVRIPY